MKRGRLLYTLLFTALATSGTQAMAQRDSFGHVFLFDIVTMQRGSMVKEPVYVSVSDTALYRIFDRFKENPGNNLTRSVPKTGMMLGVKLNPSLTAFYSAWVQSVSKVYPSFVVSDSSDATLVAMGINKSNYRKFVYRVVENDSTELIPWTAVTQLQQQYGAKQPYALIGSFRRPGKRLMVEVMEKNNYGSRDGIIFDWRVDFTPKVSQITVAMQHGYFNLAYTDLNHGYATRFNQRTGLPEDLRFPADSVSSITLQFNKPETVVYEAYLARKIKDRADTVWVDVVDQYNTLRVNHEQFAAPGSYMLFVTRKQKNPDLAGTQTLRMAFEVLPGPGTFLSKTLLRYAGALIVLLLLIMLAWRRYTVLRLRKTEQQRAVAQLQLKTIRAQLNPHFMFNALSSIQNLVNRNDVLGANHFLSTFAKLTRKVLDTSEHEMISLAEELQLATDYLEMEQLRFGFVFQVTMDDGLDADNVQVPAMLLQPFIENAVKHGISGMQQQGQVRVHAKRNGDEIVLTVTDNGRGFTVTSHQPGSFGLKLSHERIQLLNEIYSGSEASLQVASQPGNTTITILLKNWN